MSEQGRGSDQAQSAPPIVPSPHYGPVPRYGQLPVPHVAGPTLSHPPPTGGLPTGYPPVAPVQPAYATPSGLLAETPLRGDNAPWRRRAGAYLADHLPGFVGLIVFYTGAIPVAFSLGRGQVDTTPQLRPVAVGALIVLVGIGWNVYNRWLLGGRTGQSVGRRLTGTWLVSRKTGRPIGALNAFLRDLLHLADGLLCVGYLWPLWDAERQTFADKLMHTVAVTTPVEPLPRRVVAS